MQESKTTIPIDQLHEYLTERGLALVGKLEWPACERYPVLYVESQQATESRQIESQQDVTLSA